MLTQPLQQLTPMVSFSGARGLAIRKSAWTTLTAMVRLDVTRINSLIMGYT